MPSCSSSSNILASLTSLTAIQGGSRLTVSIPNPGGTGFTSGNVIRYDIATSGYTLSKANDAPSSEVFGVIEGLDASATNFNVVIYGSINLPSGKLADVGSAGGCGGNDIYFLSGVTAGKLQNLAPTDLNHIVKPVYQVSPHGSYTGVIVNYLGYRIGGEIEAVSDDRKGIGEIRVYAGNANFDPGFIDASISSILPILEYPDYYTQMGISYGYIEQITLQQTIGSISVPTPVSQSGNQVGTLIEIIRNAAPAVIRVRKNPSQSATSTTASLSISNANFTITSRQIYAVQSPIVTLGSVPTISGIGSNGSITTSVPQTSKIGIKVKPLGVNVNIPTNITTPSLTATTLVYGTGASDLETVLNDFETRISVLEQ